MNIKINSLLVRFFLLFALFICAQVFAEPYLAFKNNLQCVACHVNPIGGGERNTFGTYYGSQVLPEKAGSLAILDAGNVSETFRIGADFRANYFQRNTDSQAETDSELNSKTFAAQSGQLYMVLQPKDSAISLYIDEQIAPGSALNREAFILTKLGESNYVKAGRIMLPYGIRLEDDTAFVRQASGVNFDNSDSGVELGLRSEKTFYNFSVTNGTSAQSNDDNHFQFLARGEYMGDNWRVGASTIYNDAVAGSRSMVNIFGGINWQGYIFLAQVDRIRDKSIVNVPETFATQTVSLLEVNKEIMKGYNVKLTTEYWDPDNNIQENQRTRHSILLEYTPFANLQFRVGLRKGDDIPQNNNGNYIDFFTQLHFYY